MRIGTVVKWNHKDDLYVVSKATRHSDKIMELILIPFQHDNMTIHVSREHPFKKSVGGELVVDEKMLIDNLVYVASTISEYFNVKVKEALRTIF